MSDKSPIIGSTFDVDAFFRERLPTLIARAAPEKAHGQLCPIWTRKKDNPPISECDCWIVPDAKRLAKKILDLDAEGEWPDGA